MSRTKRIALQWILAILATSGTSCQNQTKQDGEAKTGASHKQDAPKASKENFEKQYRSWYAGFASDKRELKEKALRSMWPTKEDIEYLVPTHAAKLWPHLVEAQKHFLANLDKFAKEFSEGGAPTEISATDIRKDKSASGDYKRVLSIIPEDVAVFECFVRRGPGHSSTSGDYLYHNGRWFWFKDVFVLPDILDDLDKR